MTEQICLLNLKQFSKEISKKAPGDALIFGNFVGTNFLYAGIKKGVTAIIPKYASHIKDFRETTCFFLQIQNKYIRVVILYNQVFVKSTTMGVVGPRLVGDDDSNG